MLHLKVKANQRFNKIEKSAEGWQIRLSAPAIDGKANENLVRFLAEILALPKSAIVLKKGLSTPYKTLEITAEDEYVFNVLENESKK